MIDGTCLFRRKFPRLEMPIDGRWDGASGGRSVRITSLSLGGCFVDGMGTPRVGEVIDVTLCFPEAAPLTLSGTAVYVTQPQGFGVQFLDDALQQAEMLAKRLQESGLSDPYKEEGQ